MELHHRKSDRNWVWLSRKNNN